MSALTLIQNYQENMRMLTTLWQIAKTTAKTTATPLITGSLAALSFYGYISHSSRWSDEALFEDASNRVMDSDDMEAAVGRYYRQAAILVALAAGVALSPAVAASGATLFYCKDKIRDRLFGNGYQRVATDEITPANDVTPGNEVIGHDSDSDPAALVLI